jgi:hypothetical protein
MTCLIRLILAGTLLQPFLGAVLAAGGDAPQKVELTVSLIRQETARWEDRRLQITMKNTGSSPVTIVEPMFPRECDVVFRPSDGDKDKEQRWSVGVAPGTTDMGHEDRFGPKDYLVIKPHSAPYVADTDLGRYLENETSIGAPGRYTLTCSYAYKPSADEASSSDPVLKTLLRGSVQAQPITFEIPAKVASRRN